MNWIKVERWEDLPKESGYYWVYFEDGPGYAHIDIEDGSYYFFFFDGQCRNWVYDEKDFEMMPSYMKITHFALIEPPKDVK